MAGQVNLDDTLGNDKLGKPAKLVYYGWVTSQHQIEFQFADLPLP